MFTVHQLQTKTKTEPKALPTFWPSLLSGCEMWLALLQKGSNDKNHKVFLTGPFLHPEASQVLQKFSSSILHTQCFYWPALLVHCCGGPAARNKQLRERWWLNFITSGFNSIPASKCNGKGEHGKQRWRPHCRHSSPKGRSSWDNAKIKVRLAQVDERISFQKGHRG